MEISNTRPFDDSRGPRDASNRPPASHKSEIGQNSSPDTVAPTERPQSGGVTASSHAHGGVTRDPAEPDQKKDGIARDERARKTDSAQKIAEFVESLRQQSGAPGTTRLAIDVDENTNEPQFLVLNKDTGEVLRRIPEDEFFERLRQLALDGGLLFDQAL